jgi:cell division septum initiation protein DivIVA
MLRPVDALQDGPEPRTDDDVGSPFPQRSWSGGLDGLLDTRPVFRTRMNGYDRMQVDNYVSWVEDELAASRRAGDHLLARFAVCAAELAQFRRQPAPAATSPDLSAVSERVGQILRLASDEAAEILEAATEEADRIVADARLEAEARVQKTELFRDTAVAMVEQLRERVVRDRVEAADALERARREAEEMRRGAAAERDRLAGEAAARLALEQERARQDRDSAAAVAAGRLLAVQDELDDLRRQRDEVRESLLRLTDQIGEALHAVGVVAPDERTVRSVPEPVAS